MWFYFVVLLDRDLEDIGIKHFKGPIRDQTIIICKLKVVIKRLIVNWMNIYRCTCMLYKSNYTIIYVKKNIKYF